MHPRIQKAFLATVRNAAGYLVNCTSATLDCTVLEATVALKTTHATHATPTPNGQLEKGRPVVGLVASAAMWTRTSTATTPGPEAMGMVCADANPVEMEDMQERA